MKTPAAPTSSFFYEGFDRLEITFLQISRSVCIFGEKVPAKVIPR